MYPRSHLRFPPFKLTCYVPLFFNYRRLRPSSHPFTFTFLFGLISWLKGIPFPSKRGLLLITTAPIRKKWNSGYNRTTNLSNLIISTFNYKRERPFSIKKDFFINKGGFSTQPLINKVRTLVLLRSSKSRGTLILKLFF